MSNLKLANLFIEEWNEQSEDDELVVAFGTGEEEVQQSAVFRQLCANLKKTILTFSLKADFLKSSSTWGEMSYEK